MGHPQHDKGLDRGQQAGSRDRVAGSGECRGGRERVDYLGPPVTLIIKVRPGQTLDDFVAAAPFIAPAMNVAALEVTQLVPHWVRVVLRTAPREAMPDMSSELPVEALPFGA